MENGGGTGSAGAHFEKVTFGDEIMVPDDTLHARFSQLSLAVAADSGWYDVDFLDGDEYTYGRNEGCGMFSNRCVRSVITEFCNNVGKTTCSDNFKYISLCRKSKFTGNCNINLNHRSCKRFRKSNTKSFRYGRRSICQNCQVS
jgi:leishmanolysin